MPWTQYSRNLEDVMLWRAFGAIEEGSFLDVGAGHPVHDSTTYALYRRGWRGIALEPIEEVARLWASERPEDLLIMMAAAAAPGDKVLHMMPDSAQTSTVDERLADRWRREGLRIEPRRVPATTLNEVLDRVHEGELHLLSLDVEGFEHEALAGLDLARYRPWIMLVEAIEPGTAAPSHQAWEPEVLSAGYECAYFDGCNRFYVAAERSELKRHFGSPPGPADNYVRYPREDPIY
jgi:FkbM family methyltransferase